MILPDFCHLVCSNRWHRQIKSLPDGFPQWVASARAAARWSSDAYDPAHIHAGHVTDGPRLTVNGNHFANTGKMV